MRQPQLGSRHNSRRPTAAPPNVVMTPPTPEAHGRASRDLSGIAATYSDEEPHDWTTPVGAPVHDARRAAPSANTLPSAAAAAVPPPVAAQSQQSASSPSRRVRYNVNDNNDGSPQRRASGTTSPRDATRSYASRDDDVAGGGGGNSAEDTSRDPDHVTSGQDSIDSEDISIDESSSEARTHSTGTTSALRQASGLPCGMSMTTIMCLLILLPITFLVTYTAIPLSGAVSAQNFLSDHRHIILGILNAGLRLQEGRRDASLILGAAPNSTQSTNAFNSWINIRKHVDEQMTIVRYGGIASDMSHRLQFIAHVDKILSDLTVLRVHVTERTMNGAMARREFLRLIDNIYSLMLWVARDERAKDLESRLIIFTVLRRLQNSIGGTRASGVGFLSRDGFDLENQRALYGNKVSVERDLVILNGIGQSEVLHDVGTWQASTLRESYFSALNQILSDNPADWANVSVPYWVNTTNNFINLMHSLDMQVLDVIVNGKLLQVVSVAEGMKMMGAVLACIIAAALVAWLNYREQKRMESALRATRTLAGAVQRFVPRNQLKTMGVRSITQVTPGLQVEVAQTMLFSDIRDFTGLSEQMKNIELFEWLQSYVSRMTKVTVAEKGYVDKFIGDALFCVFPQPTNGMNAAIQMHVSTDQLNLELVAQKRTKMVAIGVGLHYGVVVAGVFGDSTRLSCTMVASDVNLASRLEALTKSFGAKIIASEAVISQVDAGAYDLRPLGKVQVAGSTIAVPIFDVFQTDTLPLKNFKHATLLDFTRAVELVDRDPAAASLSFARLAKRARACGLVDVAAECKSDGVLCSPQAAVLEFEKNGDRRHNSASLSNGEFGPPTPLQLASRPESAQQLLHVPE